MSDSLLPIALPVLPEDVRARLNAVYERVPGVSCDGCDNPGKCCWLTEEEMDDEDDYLKGNHGGVSKEEMFVPLVIIKK